MEPESGEKKKKKFRLSSKRQKAPVVEETVIPVDKHKERRDSKEKHKHKQETKQHKDKDKKHKSADKEKKKKAQSLPSISLPVPTPISNAETKEDQPHSISAIESYTKQLQQQYESDAAKITQKMTPRKERPRSVQPARARSSMQLSEPVQRRMNARNSVTFGATDPILPRHSVNNTNEKRVKPLDIGEEEDEEEYQQLLADMAYYNEKRSVIYSHDDMERTTPLPAITIATTTTTPWNNNEEKEEPSFLPYMTLRARSPRLPSPRPTPRPPIIDIVKNTVVLTPEGGSLDPASCRLFRTGVLNERKPINCRNNNDGEDENDCFVCCRTQLEYGSVRSITALTGRLVLGAVGTEGERPIFRVINICNECQFKRDLSNPLVPLPAQSLALYKPLVLCDGYPHLS